MTTTTRRNNMLTIVRQGERHPAYRNASRILKTEFGYTTSDITAARRRAGTI